MYSELLKLLDRLESLQDDLQASHITWAADKLSGIVEDLDRLLMEPEPCDDDDGLSDVEADAMTLRDAGMGTDEDYGLFSGPED